MKPLRKHLKLIALLLSVAVMLQSCNIYKSRVSTIEEAVESKRRVKIKSETHPTYKFKQLISDGEKLYGVAHDKTRTAKILKDQIVSTANNPTYVQIMLSNSQIGEIHELNRPMSILLPIIILVVLVTLGALFPPPTF